MALPDSRACPDRLRPARIRREWLLEAERVHASALRGQLASAQARHDAARSAARDCALAAADAWQRRADPCAYVGAMALLGALNARERHWHGEAGRLAQVLAQAEARVTGYQVRLEALRRQRAQALAGFAREQAAVEARRADEAWLARRACHWEMPR